MLIVVGVLVCRAGPWGGVLGGAPVPAEEVA